MNIVIADGKSLAFEDQLNQLIKLASKLSNEIGFVPACEYRRQAKRSQLLLLLINNILYGFCSFNIRQKDNIAVIYEIATHPAIRGKGGGKMLINEILKKAEIIELKCPINNKSNNFYNKIGKKIRVDDGKKRQLNVWQITNKTVQGNI